MSPTLKENLSNWTDPDAASYFLGLALGLIAPDIKFGTHAKHVFWTNNPVGNTLFQILDDLAEVGVLEKDKELSKYKWNPSFKGSWE